MKACATSFIREPEGGPESLHIGPEFTPRRPGGACAWPCVLLGARGLRAWRARWGVRAARRACESRRTVSVPPAGATAFCRSSSSRVSRLRVGFLAANAMRPRAPCQRRDCKEHRATVKPREAPVAFVVLSFVEMAADFRTQFRPLVRARSRPVLFKRLLRRD